MRGLFAFTLVWLAGIAPIGAAEMPESLRAFLIEYRCPVVDRLDRMYEFGDRSSDRDRFIALSLAANPSAYVQCIFRERQTRMLCEAASGFYSAKDGEPRRFSLARPAIDALARLGFSTDDSEGNFQIDFAVTNTPNFNAIADLMLRALHDSYGARIDTDMRVNVPFARKATTKCVPVS